jgi:hypothetical protein
MGLNRVVQIISRSHLPAKCSPILGHWEDEMFVEAIYLRARPDEEREQAELVYEGGCEEGDCALLDMPADTRAAEKLFSEGKSPHPSARTIHRGALVPG